METKIKVLKANDILENARIRINAFEQQIAANAANRQEPDGE